MKKVSIIIPIYNSENFIERCLESIISQTYSNIEIIIINDGSTDGTERILKEYEKKDKRVKNIFIDNSGVSTARNIGIENATGDMIMFIDSDDYIDENFIETCMKYADEFDIIKGGYVVEKGKRVNKEKLNEEYQCQKLIKDIAIGKFSGCCWGYLIKSESIKEIRFDKSISYMEDTIFILECLIKNNEDIKIVNEVSYYYCNNENSLTKKKGNIDRIRQYFKAIDKIHEIVANYGIKCKSELDYRKIGILEAGLGNCQNIFEIYDKNNIDIYREVNQICCNCKRNFNKYSVFMYIMQNKEKIMLKIYYKARSIIKKIK